MPLKTFTPSRWALESRPLREEAAPFFFDMGQLPFFAVAAVMPVISTTDRCWRWPQRRRLLLLGL